MNEKKKEVRKATSSEEMIDMLISNLHRTSARAENLANTLEHGKYEPRRRMDRQERELASLVINSHMNDVLDEAKFHAMQDNEEQFQNSTLYIVDLMAFKRDF